MTKKNEMKIFWRAQSQLKLIRSCRKMDEFGSESLCAIRLDVHIWFAPRKHCRFFCFVFLETVQLTPMLFVNTLCKQCRTPLTGKNTAN